MPKLPGCVSQGESMDGLPANMRESIAAWMEAEAPGPLPGEPGRVVELTA